MVIRRQTLVEFTPVERKDVIWPSMVREDTLSYAFPLCVESGASSTEQT